MSVFEIYKQDGVKFMRPIHTREEYLSKRNNEHQRQILKTVRESDARQKNRLIQMNYSCLPNKRWYAERIEDDEHHCRDGHRPHTQG